MTEKLFDAFPRVSTEAWERKILKDLKGADYEKKLIWHSDENIRVKPFYRKADLVSSPDLGSDPGKWPFIRGNQPYGNPWEIRQDILVEDVREANKTALSVLKRGANSLGFIFKNTDLPDNSFLKELLNGIQAEMVSMHFEGLKDFPGFLQKLRTWTKSHSNPNTELKGSLNYDPLGNLLQTGDHYNALQSDKEMGQELLRIHNAQSAKLKMLAVNGRHYVNAGASSLQELAFSLAQANQYLEWYTDAGLQVGKVAHAIQFNMGVGSNYFMEIAKLRALRYLWSGIVSAYEGSEKTDAKTYIHSTTTRWNKTIFDPYVNMLRTTSEAMSAVLAGTDSLCVEPFDAIFASPSGFSTRIARNIQIILQEEAYFGKVSDPAAGSYYIEYLSGELCREAWQIFLDIRNRGGYYELLCKGHFQKQVFNAARQKQEQLAKRKKILVGTNQYPNAEEEILDSVKLEDVIISSRAKGQVCKPLPQNRLSYEVEKIRLRTERSGKTPKVFLFTYGHPGMRRARAEFANNFFAVAGFDILDNLGFPSIREGLEAMHEAKPDMVVLCSADENYKELAGAVVPECRDRYIPIIAGYPEADLEELKATGVAHFIHIRSSLLEELKQYQDLLDT